MCCKDFVDEQANWRLSLDTHKIGSKWSLLHCFLVISTWSNEPAHMHRLDKLVHPLYIIHTTCNKNPDPALLDNCACPFKEKLFISVMSTIFTGSSLCNPNVEKYYLSIMHEKPTSPRIITNSTST